MNVDPEAVLAALQRARGQGLTLKQLGSELHLPEHARQPLRKALAQLVASGRAVFDGHRYREAVKQQPRKSAPAAMVEGARARREKTPPPVRAGSEVTGVIHLKSEGYGFVSPLIGEGGRENDLFIPPQFVKGALDGD